MCRAVRCSKCGKTTWAGCGKHVDQVMSKVAEADRCTCPRDDEPAGGSSGGWRSIFGRRTGTPA